MIVIPNGGAVWRWGDGSGPFTTDAYYNEYSLMATIEDTLRVRQELWPRSLTTTCTPHP